jgi:hypothetical protein
MTLSNDWRALGRTALGSPPPAIPHPFTSRAAPLAHDSPALFVALPRDEEHADGCARVRGVRCCARATGCMPRAQVIAGDKAPLAAASFVCLPPFLVATRFLVRDAAPLTERALCEQLHGLQPGFWPHGMDPSSSGSNGHISMMRAVHERMVQRPRTGSGGMNGGMNGMKSSAPGGVSRGAGMLPNQMPLRTDGMLRARGSSGRSDALMPSGSISFGVDAYNAFRGMFESSGSMGVNIAAGPSGGSGLIGSQPLPVTMRGPSGLGNMGLPALSAELSSDFVSRFPQASASHGDGIGDVREAREVNEFASAPAPAFKSAYADLANVPDILTNGG